MTHLKKTVIKFGGKKPAPPKTSPFEVRPGTAAVVKIIVGGDVVAGQLAEALIELWVEKKRKVVRKRDGVTREWLFLSASDLVTLSGLTERQISERAIPRLKNCPFFIFKRGRMTTNDVNQHQIHFDEAAFWEEVRSMLDPTTVVKETMDGATFAKKEIDRKKLPYLFKRLFDAISDGD